MRKNSKIESENDGNKNYVRNGEQKKTKVKNKNEKKSIMVKINKRILWINNFDEINE